MASGQTATLRILCFGDSLTSGYSSYGAIHHPYHADLEAVLASGLPNRRFKITEDGKDGDMVTSAMRGGFFGRIQKHFGPDKPTYDWTIVLGGTNDIGFRIDPDRVFQNLKDVYSVPLSHGGKVLAITIPEDGAENKSIHDRLAVQRNKLNNLIKQYAKETPDVYVYDLHAAVQFFTMSLADRERYWDDNIHFTPDGYDLIGQKVGIALLGILAKEESEKANGIATSAPEEQPSSTVRIVPAEEHASKDVSSAEESKRKAIALAMNTQLTPPKKRRLKGFRDDERLFEEEEGSPNALEKGYIVVRKKDLYE